MTITREEAENMSQAHAEGLHTPPEGVPREGCPDCEGRELRSYPSYAQIKKDDKNGDD
jgi:hypothetical protein